MEVRDWVSCIAILSLQRINTIYTNKIQKRTKNIGPIISIPQHNIEGISQSKSECVSRIVLANSIDIIALQETHTRSNERGLLHGFQLVSHIAHILDMSKVA